MSNAALAQDPTGNDNQRENRSLQKVVVGAVLISLIWKAVYFIFLDYLVNHEIFSIFQHLSERITQNFKEWECFTFSRSWEIVSCFSNSLKNSS